MAGETEQSSEGRVANRAEESGIIDLLGDALASTGSGRCRVASRGALTPLTMEQPLSANRTSYAAMPLAA